MWRYPSGAGGKGRGRSEGQVGWVDTARRLKAGTPPLVTMADTGGVSEGGEDAGSVLVLPLATARPPRAPSAPTIRAPIRIALGKAYAALWRGGDGEWKGSYAELATEASGALQNDTVTAEQAGTWWEKAMASQQLSARRKAVIESEWTSSPTPRGSKPGVELLAQLAGLALKDAIAPGVVERCWGLLNKGDAGGDSAPVAGGGGRRSEGGKKKERAPAVPVAAPAAGAQLGGYEESWDANLEEWCANRLLARRAMLHFRLSRAPVGGGGAESGGGLIGARAMMVELVETLTSIESKGVMK